MAISAAPGLDVLRCGGPLNNEVLKQFPEFREFAGPGATAVLQHAPQVLDVPTAEQTPEEQLEAGYLRHHDGLASEVLARVRQ